MDSLREDFREIYDTLTGCHRLSGGMPWVPDISTDGSAYDRAYQTLWEARQQLALRFGVPVEDEALERIMNTILDLELEVGFHMFRMGMEYQQKGAHL